MVLQTLVLAFSLAVVAGSAAGQDTSDVVRVDLLPGWRQADGRHVAGLRITLAPGWKTYWRAPGEAGIAPRFDWSGSENLASAETLWPAPEVFELNGIRSIGYEGTVVLPLLLDPAREGRVIALDGRVDFGVCETICMPVSRQVAGLLPVGGKAAGPIAAALAEVAERPGHEVRCRIEPIADGLLVTATVDMPPVGRDEVAVIEPSDPAIWVSEARTDRRSGRLTVEAELVPPEGAPFALDRSRLRLTVLADGRAVEMTGCTAG